MIDNCASGGRRLDLETISRSVALWRSDFQCNPELQPRRHAGADLRPLFLDSAERGRRPGHQPLSLPQRLGRGVILNTGLDHAEQLRPLVEEARQLQPYFLGDYYPLTPYSLGDSDWLAIQFNRPEQADGIVLAYRRPACVADSLRLKLHGLDPAAQYEVRSLDEPAAAVVTGKTLLADGLPVHLISKPAAAVIRYRRVAPAAPH